MSEQVGASLVLAQIFAPLQASPQSQEPPGSTLPTGATELENRVQHIDITEESPAVFASLLNELTTLEVQSAENPHDALVGALIHVRVDTAPLTEAALEGIAGNTPPGGGNRQPGSGTILPVEGNIIAPADTAIAPKADPSTTAAIIIRERQVADPNSRLDGLPPDEASRVPTPAETPRPAPTDPTNGNKGAIALPVADQVNDTRAEQRLHPNAATNVDNRAMMDAADAESGDSSGRQDQPRPPAMPTTGRSPSISFSHDGSLAATIANGITQAPSAQSGLVPIGGSPAAQPALTLLGAPANWAEPLAERLASVASRGTNTAEVKLHPPSLGALEIRITVNNDQASLWVASANADVRDALQQALPRLDSLLSNLGIELADSEIADRQTREFASEGEGGSSSNDGDTTDDVSADPAARLGLIDTWA